MKDKKITLKLIRKYWLECYGEELRKDYIGFYRMIKKIEIENKRNSQLKNN